MQNKIHRSEIEIQRRLVVAFLLVASVFLSWFGISRGMPAIGLLIPAVGLASELLARPVLILILALFVYSAHLIVPGMPSSVTLHLLLLVFMIGRAILDCIFRRRNGRGYYVPHIDLWMIVFLINLLMVMSVRGSGFALFGSRTFGGATYVTAIISILFYFAGVRIRLHGKGVKWLLWGVFFGFLIYAVAEVSVYYFRGQLWWLSRFVSLPFGQVMEGGENQATQLTDVRWDSFRWMGFALLPIAYVWVRQAGVRLILVGVALFLVLLTGFRSALVQLGTLIFFASMYYSSDREKTFMLWAISGGVGLVAVILLSPVLPFTIQRSLSFLPFVQVSHEVTLTAEGSTNFRLDLWRDYCIPNVPQFLLIGRGLAHDISQFSWLSSRWYKSDEFFYHMGNYHSGPFSVLLDLGLPGAVSFFAFFGLVIMDSWKAVRRYATGNDSLTCRYFVFITILMTYEIFSFVFIYGDIGSQLFPFLALAVQLRILGRYIQNNHFIITKNVVDNGG